MTKNSLPRQNINAQQHRAGIKVRKRKIFNWKNELRDLEIQVGLSSNRVRSESKNGTP
jgi:hypothetical protein